MNWCPQGPKISPIVVLQPSCTGGAKRCRCLFQDFYPDYDVLVGETNFAMAPNFPLAFHGAAIWTFRCSQLTNWLQVNLFLANFDKKQSWRCVKHIACTKGFEKKSLTYCTNVANFWTVLVSWIVTLSHYVCQ